VEVSILVFLAGGLFLGWSLGANDAANVFGTAVGTRMVRFGLAAAVCSVFVILGAVISGAGAAHTLGKLGAVNTVAGAGMAAFSAALTVYWMTRLGVPVSTSQAIVGAIIGWNLFTGSPTDSASLVKILATWVAGPLLAGIIGVLLFKITSKVVTWTRPHIFRLDAYTRGGLILAGALGAYSLGANNIANVMGVFVPSNPFTAFGDGELFRFTAIQQLFLLGALAIAVGVFTYSKRVMMTVGSSLFPLSPLAAWVVVVAHSIVLLLFASQSLEHLLASNGLPTIPLVPVSSSQAVVGAVIGIGLLKGGRGIRWRVLGGIASGWITTPIIAGIICFVSLFFLQNVFNQRVFQDHAYVLSAPVMEKLADEGVATTSLSTLQDRRFDRWTALQEALQALDSPQPALEKTVRAFAMIEPLTVTRSALNRLSGSSFSPEQRTALRAMIGQHFLHRWRFEAALAERSAAWRALPVTPVNKQPNRQLKDQLEEAYLLFRD
jgi:inorganic phosphate transporter, PiT family